jgi:hypothetical protein
MRSFEKPLGRLGFLWLKQAQIMPEFEMRRVGLEPTKAYARGS